MGFTQRYPYVGNNPVAYRDPLGLRRRPWSEPKSNGFKRFGQGIADAFNCVYDMTNYVPDRLNDATGYRDRGNEWLSDRFNQANLAQTAIGLGCGYAAVQTGGIALVVIGSSCVVGLWTTQTIKENELKEKVEREEISSCEGNWLEFASLPPAGGVEVTIFKQLLKYAGGIFCPEAVEASVAGQSKE